MGLYGFVNYMRTIVDKKRHYRFDLKSYDLVAIFDAITFYSRR